jgi:hypothetical protein
MDDDPKRRGIQGNRSQEEERKSVLQHRLKERLAEIDQERHLSEKPPNLLGVAVILPPPKEVVASVEGMESDPEIEAIAVEITKQHEISEGRKPVSVEEENCGWDVTSLLAGQVARYIEVKGRAGVGSVALTPNEWIKAQRFGKDYWLYIVTNCKGTPQLHLIQDPASKLTDIANCESFDELLILVEAATAKIRRFGELAAYDTALRIGAWLKLSPELVYLHAGTRMGAMRLGLGRGKRYIALGDLPIELGELSADQAEDLLCIFKGHFLSMRTRNLRAVQSRCLPPNIGVC